MPSKAPPPLACSNCGLRDLCLPLGLTTTEVERLDGLVRKRQGVARGTALYRAGKPFEALYAVRTGFFKTRMTPADGREHITGFQLAGDLLGLDGLASDRHICDAVALEDSQVCAIPFARLQELARAFPGLQRRLHHLIGREIVRGHAAMQLLSRMCADERVAAFVLDLAQRLAMRGLSSSALVLRTTREEIGTFLGLKLETVSRSFSKLQENGLLEVRGRHIRILDAPALERLANGSTPG